MPIEFNTKAPQTQMQTTTPADQIAKMIGDSTKAKEVVSKALEVLAGANLSVTKSDNAGADGVAEKKTSGATNVPALDNPGDPEQVEANLEKLISYLQLENEDLQSKQAKDRIELQKGQLDVEHEGRMNEIDESIKKMKDAERASKINRFFGWLGAILSVVAALSFVSMLSVGPTYAYLRLYAPHEVENSFTPDLRTYGTKIFRIIGSLWQEAREEHLRLLQQKKAIVS